MHDKMHENHAKIKQENQRDSIILSMNPLSYPFSQLAVRIPTTSTLRIISPTRNPSRPRREPGDKLPGRLRPAPSPAMGRRPLGSEANCRCDRPADASRPRYRPKSIRRQGRATVGPNASLLERYPAGTMGNRSESLGWGRSHPARRRTCFLRRLARRIQHPSGTAS